MARYSVLMRVAGTVLQDSVFFMFLEDARRRAYVLNQVHGARTEVRRADGTVDRRYGS